MVLVILDQSNTEWVTQDRAPLARCWARRYLSRRGCGFAILSAAITGGRADLLDLLEEST
jgi:hypothetical protein